MTAQDERGSPPLEWSRRESRLTLRFRNRDVERAFQTDAGDRFRLEVKLTIVLGMATWAAAGVLLPMVFPVDPANVAAAVIVVEAVIVALLALFDRAHTWDQEQALGGTVNLIGGLAIIWVGGFVAAQPQLVAPALLANMIFAFGLSRLGVVVGLGITVPYLLVFGLLVLAGRLPGVGPFEVFLTLVGLAVASLACYLLERSERTLFVQRGIIAKQSRSLAEEKEKSERLLRNTLPESVALRLRDGPVSMADAHPDVSVLFADLVGFTPLAATLSPAATVALLNDLFSRFDELAGRHGLEKIKTIGDEYMAVAGAPEPVVAHARRAVAMGLDMLAEVADEAARRDLPLDLRVGIHSGPIAAGVIGRTRLSYDLWGDTVNVASRMQSQGVAGAVQISEATAAAMGGAFAAEPRGTIDVRGKGPMRTFLLRPAGVELESPLAVGR